MADVSFTATAIAAGANATTVTGTFGDTVTQGKAVYLSSSDNKYYLADTTDADKDAVAGIALTSGANGQPCVILTAGNLTCDGLTAGETYILSEAGAIAPIGDVATGDYVTLIGVATATTTLKVNILISSTAHA